MKRFPWRPGCLLPSLCLGWVGDGGQQRSKSAVLSSAVSGGLNAGVAEEKPLIKLYQMSIKTQLTCYSRDVFNTQECPQVQAAAAADSE